MFSSYTCIHTPIYTHTHIQKKTNNYEITFENIDLIRKQVIITTLFSERNQYTILNA